MKKIMVIFILFCFVCQAQASDVPQVRYNLWHLVEGYRLGFISNFGSEGIQELWMLEGQLNQGTATTMGPIYDRVCVEEHEKAANSVEDPQRHAAIVAKAQDRCYLTEQPWPFSATDSDLLKQWDSMGVVPVVIYFERPVWTPYQLVTQTRDYLLGIFPINPSLAIEKKHVLRSSLGGGKYFNREKKTIVGRIVKATLEQPIRKVYEVVIEEGLTGNSFLRMNVDDSDMFDYIVQAMLTGKMLRIEYVRFYGFEGVIPSEIFNYNTNFRITSVELTDVDYQLPAFPIAPKGGN